MLGAEALSVAAGFDTGGAVAVAVAFAKVRLATKPKLPDIRKMTKVRAYRTAWMTRLSARASKKLVRP